MMATLRISVAVKYSYFRLFEATSFVPSQGLSRDYDRVTTGSRLLPRANLRLPRCEIRLARGRRNRRRLRRGVEKAHFRAAIAQHVRETRLVVRLHVGLLRLHLP